MAKMSFYDCCKQSFNWLYHPSTHPAPDFLWGWYQFGTYLLKFYTYTYTIHQFIHPSSTRLLMGLIPNFYSLIIKKISLNSNNSRCPKSEHFIWKTEQNFVWISDIVRLYYKCPKSERSVSRVDQPNIWNLNCLGIGQLWKAPKSEHPDFRHLL